jgi:hypothetical protein
MRQYHLLNIAVQSTHPHDHVHSSSLAGSVGALADCDDAPKLAKKRSAITRSIITITISGFISNLQSLAAKKALGGTMIENNNIIWHKIIWISSTGGECVLLAL